MLDVTVVQKTETLVYYNTEQGLFAKGMKGVKMSLDSSPHLHCTPCHSRGSLFGVHRGTLEVREFTEMGLVVDNKAGMLNKKYERERKEKAFSVVSMQTFCGVYLVVVVHIRVQVERSHQESTQPQLIIYDIANEFFAHRV